MWAIPRSGFLAIHARWKASSVLEAAFVLLSQDLLARLSKVHMQEFSQLC